MVSIEEVLQDIDHNVQKMHDYIGVLKQNQTHLEEIIAEHQRLKEQFMEATEGKESKEENESHSWWTPLEGGEYISLDIYGGIKTKSADLCNPHIYSDKENANCYSLEEKYLAELDRRKLIARQRIQRTADKLHGKRFHPAKDEWAVYVLTYQSQDDYEVFVTKDRFGSEVCFKTQSIAEGCLYHCKDDFDLLYKELV